MAQAITLSGPSLGAADGDRCKCVLNPRTKKYARLCFVGKSGKHRSGFKFVKGGDALCRRR